MRYRPGDETPDDRLSVRERVRTVLITGLALTVPVLVTVMVLGIAFNVVTDTINPVVFPVQNALGIDGGLGALLLDLVAVATLVVFIFAVGLVAETRQGDRIERTFDAAMARIPGIGSLYTSFNQMSEVLLDNDTQSFREVYLVEYPTEGSYTVAFLTAETPEFVIEATDSEEMVTLFLPMAPNPVMGGFVIHVSTDRVHEVDMTVQEGIRSIVTSGVTVGEGEASTDPRPLSEE